ncbi:MAG: DNA polymerase III subunit delta [Candidatus Margulisiibacteriota bacterium]
MAKQIYLFYGDEEYLCGEKIAALRQNAEKQGANIEQIDGSGVDKNVILNTLQTDSLFATNKLVIIDQVDLTEPLWDSLVPALSVLPPSISVVFRVSAISRKSVLFKYLDQNGEVYEYKSFAEWESPQVVTWICKKVSTAGKSIDQSTAEKLQAICGSDLLKLSSEIDKIITYIGDRPKIIEQDVLSLASSSDISVFLLPGALADKNLKEVLEIFHRLYANKADLFSLLSLIANQYRIMLVALSLPARERTPQEIARRMGGSPFFIRKCTEKIAKHNSSSLTSYLELILETDLGLKSGAAPVTSMEMLFASLCS